MSDPIVGHKVVLLGETSVGKSCLSVRFAKGEFMRQEATLAGEIPSTAWGCVVPLRALHFLWCLSAAYLSKTVSVDGKPVKFDIWDTSGQG